MNNQFTVPCPLFRTPARVDDAAEDGEETRRAVDLVEDDEAVGVLREERFGVFDPCAILGVSEVEIQRRVQIPGPSCREVAGKRRLPDLPRPDEPDDRCAPQRDIHVLGGFAKTPCRPDTPRSKYEVLTPPVRSAPRCRCRAD
jgi:hypothetical protein